jgi:hypothetical protein
MSFTNHHGLNPVILSATAVSFIGAITWGFHQFLSETQPPFDGPLDWIVHLVMGFLKLAAILMFPLTMRPLYMRFHGNSRNVIAFALFLLLGYAGLFVLYIFFGREYLAVLASNDSVRFYYLHSPILDNSGYIGLEEWREEWARLIPQAKEGAMMAICLTIFVMPGYLYGSSRRAIVSSFAFLVLACVILPVVFGLLLWDYDIFLGGVFFDLLSLDLIPFLWWNVSNISGVFFVLATFFYGYALLFCRIVSLDLRKDWNSHSAPLDSGRSLKGR